MEALPRIAPAMVWRAFFFALGLTAAGRLAAAPASAPPELAQIGKPDAQEAARILEQFRRAGVAGEFFFEFDFRALPRRGPERVFQGRLWGGRTRLGAAFRVELADRDGGSHRFLLQNGEGGAVWRWRDGRVAKLSAAETLAPLVPGVEVTAFDLQMPFLYWPGGTLEKIARVMGRPAYAFLFRVPKDPATTGLEVQAARAYLDTQYNALMQTELLGPMGKAIKSFSLVSLKKVGDQYIPKQADYRNEISGDKTRLQVTGAALNLRLPASIFSADHLSIPLESPASATITLIAR